MYNKLNFLIVVGSQEVKMSEYITEAEAMSDNCDDENEDELSDDGYDSDGYPPDDC